MAPIAGFFAPAVHCVPVGLARSFRRPQRTIQRIRVDARRSGFGVRVRVYFRVYFRIRRRRCLVLEHRLCRRRGRDQEKQHEHKKHDAPKCGLVGPFLATESAGCPRVSPRTVPGGSDCIPCAVRGSCRCWANFHCRFSLFVFRCSLFVVRCRVGGSVRSRSIELLAFVPSKVGWGGFWGVALIQREGRRRTARINQSLEGMHWNWNWNWNW